MITCEEFMADLGDFLGGESAAEVREQLEYHLAHCLVCQVIYDSTGKTVKIVTETGSFDLAQEISEEITGKIMAKLQSHKDQPASKKSEP